MKKYLVIIILAVALGGFVAYEIFHEPPEPVTKTKTVTKDYYDTITDTVIKTDLRIQYRDTGSYEVKWKYKDVDTSAILRDYFSKNFYQDTIWSDSSYLAIIKDTISRNRITYRQFEVNQFRKTRTITRTITKYPQQAIYIGAGAGKFGEEFGLTGNVHYRSSDMLYSLGYDVINSNVTISASWKLWNK